jgi:hypothetical protein
MSSIFKFGEVVSGYNIRVLNEREIRAGAGFHLYLCLLHTFGYYAEVLHFLLCCDDISCRYAYEF